MKKNKKKTAVISANGIRYFRSFKKAVEYMLKENKRKWGGAAL